MKLDLETKRDLIEVLEDMDRGEIETVAKVMDVFGIVPRMDDDGNVFFENTRPPYEEDVEWGGDGLWWEDGAYLDVDPGDPSMLERKGQAISCKYLHTRGWSVVAQNVDSLIDIVAVDDDGVVVPVHVTVDSDSQKAPDPVPSEEVLSDFLRQCNVYVDSLRTYGPEYRQPGKLPNRIDWRADCIGIGIDVDSGHAQLRHLVGVDE